MPPSHVIVHLADRPFLARLTALDLAGALLGNDGLQALLVSPWLRGLTSLGLRECQISDRGVRALAQWPFLTRLTRLDLSHNEIGPPGVRLLARSLEVRAAGGDPSRLVSLPLHGNPLGQAGRRAVHSSPLLTRRGRVAARRTAGPPGAQRVLTDFEYPVFPESPHGRRGPRTGVHADAGGGVHPRPCVLTYAMHCLLVVVRDTAAGQDEIDLARRAVPGLGLGRPAPRRRRPDRAGAGRPAGAGAAGNLAARRRGPAVSAPCRAGIVAFLSRWRCFRRSAVRRAGSCSGRSWCGTCCAWRRPPSPSTPSAPFWRPAWRRWGTPPSRAGRARPGRGGGRGAAFLIYARLLGRLAWRMGRLPSGKRKLAKKVRLTRRSVEIQDPWAAPEERGDARIRSGDDALRQEEAASEGLRVGAGGAAEAGGECASLGRIHPGSSGTGKDQASPDAKHPEAGDEAAAPRRSLYFPRLRRKPQGVAVAVAGVFGRLWRRLPLVHFYSVLYGDGVNTIPAASASERFSSEPARWRIAAGMPIVKPPPPGPCR